jgi:subtilisin-like proprotein convertase family protein
VRVPTSLAWGWDSTSAHLVNFTLQTPETLAPWGNYAGNYLAGLDFDATNTFTRLFAIEGANWALFSSFDTSTGAQTPIGNAAAFATETFSGLSADPTTGQMYAASCSLHLSSLYTIDVATGAATRIGQITNSPCTIGIAIQPGTGQMYGYDVINDSLMRIDKASGAGTVIGPLGFDANFDGGLDFDDSDGTLYLFAFNMGTFSAELRTADLVTGATTLVGTFPNPGTGEEIAGAGIAASSGPPAPFIVTAGSTITAEGCSPGNGAIDPGEVVTLDFGFKNTGALDTTDMVATLQATGGVTPITTSQDYGALGAGDPAVSRSFQFAASGACGGTLVASFDLADGATSLGTRTFSFTLGSGIATGPTTFSNPNPILINDVGPATPYPSDIAVAGLTGNVSKVTVTLDKITHTYPNDIEVILQGPAGDVVGLMANAGGGHPGPTDVTITLDDAASTPIPHPLTPGTFFPTAPGIIVPFPVPAPAGPYGIALSTLNGTDPNGTWSLYVIDDEGDLDIGFMEGWSVAITTSTPDCCQGPQEISLGDVSVAEGDTGTVNAFLPVTLNPPAASTVSVDFTTQDGTATTADNDYTPLSGTLAFAPGETVHMVTISVVGDTNFEADETFFVSLSNPVGATILDGLGVGTILNDDKPLAANTNGELVHDSRETRDLDTISRFWRITQKAHSSYEVVIDAVTGDIGAGGPELLRVASDGTTVLQSGTSTSGGSSKSLHFENGAATDNNAEFIRVHSTGCVADCDPSDTVRVRAYDTTYRFSRFNNSATQITVLVIANPTHQAVAGNVWFYSTGGQLLTSQAVGIPAHGTFVLNTATVGPLQGQAGSATFSNDAPFGALTGKAVAVEPATGFTFDTPMVARAPHPPR